MLVPNYYFFLFKRFLNNFRSDQNLRKFPEKTLVLIDFFDHERGGHFGLWLAWFAAEFSKRFDRVLVLTPCPNKTYRMVRKRGCYLQNQFFLRLPESLVKSLDLKSILKKTVSKSSNLHIFIMWGYDLLNCESILPINYPWSTLIGISWAYRRDNNDSAEMENKLLEILDRDDNCRAFFQPDSYLKGYHKKEVWITDFEDIKISKRETSLVKSIKKFCNSNLSIGAFGMLHGERCVNEILLLARTQPNIRFVIAGKIFYSGIQKELIDDLKPGMRDNLLILNSFIKNEAELNSVINSVDALLIDGANYPVQSGIVCRAIHFGKWILSPEGNSWTNDVITKEGVGHLYKNRDEDIEKYWKQWKAGGGESRSTEYSNELRDSSTITNCFDELTRRLVQ
jgi:hypothetical protein